MTLSRLIKCDRHSVIVIFELRCKGHCETLMLYNLMKCALYLELIVLSLVVLEEPDARFLFVF